MNKTIFASLVLLGVLIGTVCSMREPNNVPRKEFDLEQRKWERAKRLLDEQERQAARQAERLKNLEPIIRERNKRVEYYESQKVNLALMEAAYIKGHVSLSDVAITRKQFVKSAAEVAHHEFLYGKYLPGAKRAR